MTIFPLPAFWYLFRRIERVIEDRRPTLIVIDEAWKMLDDPMFVKRLHDWLVTMRKKNAAVMMLTQTPTHLTQSKVGQIIAEGVVTQLLYPNPRANPEDYRILRLNEKEAEFLCTPTGGLRLALLRSAGDSVFVNMDLGALGPLLRCSVVGGPAKTARPLVGNRHLISGRICNDPANRTPPPHFPSRALASIRLHWRRNGCSLALPWAIPCRGQILCGAPDCRWITC